MNKIDTEKYEIVPIYITKDNEWYTGAPLKEIETYKDMDLLKRYTDNVVLYKKDDELRGFNHVVEVFKSMGLDVYQVIEKTEHFKQAEKSARERQSIKKYLRLNTTKTLNKQRVLIVDDIYTTGATINAAIKLVETLNPKEIRVLVLAKTINKEDKKSNTKQSLH